MPKDLRQLAVNRQKTLAKLKLKRKETLRHRNVHSQGMTFKLCFGSICQENEVRENGAWNADDE